LWMQAIRILRYGCGTGTRENKDQLFDTLIKLEINRWTY
jgi:hypothetical protein